MKTKDYVSGAQKTVHYDQKKPIYYKGYAFPTTDMEVVDENGYSLGLRPVFIDGIGQRFYKSKEGKVIPITSQYLLDDVIITPSGNYKTTMDRNAEPFRFQNVTNTPNVNNTPNVKEEKPKPTAEEQEILRKQSLLKAAGYNVPYEGAWDSQQEGAWDKLTTRNKQYDNTLAGTFQGLMDQFNGETTEKRDPFNQGEVKTYDEKNIDLGKTRRSQSDIVKSLEGTYGPIVAAIMFPKLFANGVVSGLTTMGGGYMGGKAVDKLSESLTGNDFGTNVAKYTPLSPDLAEWLNPGNVVGGKAGYNFGKNIPYRNRFVMDNVTPNGYLRWSHIPEFMKAGAKMTYQKPPTFFGRKPIWYEDFKNQWGEDAAQNRLQNNAIWAGITEDEIPTPLYIKNSDGSWRLTPDGIGQETYGVPTSKDLLPSETTIDYDYFTKGGVGGKHSDYTNLWGNNNFNIMQFKDEQKINPQWIIASGLKKALFTDSNSKIGKVIDKFGSYPLGDKLFGYKPFTIKQNYVIGKGQFKPILEDPNLFYIPNFTLGE